MKMIPSEMIIEIWSKVMNLSEIQAKLALFGLIMVTEGGGKIPVAELLDTNLTLHNSDSQEIGG